MYFFDQASSCLSISFQVKSVKNFGFADAGVIPKVISETNALTAAMVMAREGLAATVVPSILIETLGQPSGTIVLNLVDPVLAKPIALVTAVRTPSLPTVEALRRAGHALRDGQKFDQ